MSDREFRQTSEDAADRADARLEQLVSYLDGELEDVESDRLERQLSADPPLRVYVETLDRTWRLLDSLDEATASGEFTQRTLASLDTVAADPSTDAIPMKTRVRRLLASGFVWRCAGWCLIGFAAGAAALMLARSDRPGRVEVEDRRLLDDLEFLQQYRELRSVPDENFLRQLVSPAPSASAEEGTQP